MKVVINDTKTISQIQKEFNDVFPYLQIQFFTKPHKRGAASPRGQMAASDKKIGECRSVHKSGSITITPSMTVNELEQKFQAMFGLSVQVFRKSGKAWLQTNVTDDWTLEEQNSEGEALSRITRKREIPDQDLDIE